MSARAQNPFLFAMECLTRMSVLRETQRALGAQAAEVAEALDRVQPFLTREEQAALASSFAAESALDARGTTALRGAPTPRRRAEATPASPQAPAERPGAPLPPLVAEILDAHDPSIPPRPATGPLNCWTCGGGVVGPRETYCLRCRAQGLAEIPRGVEPCHE